MKLKDIKATYIFNILAFLILLATILIYKEFGKTKHIIEKTNIDANLKYVDDISDNILGFIKKDLNDKELFEFLDNNEKQRLKLESYLEIFTTDRYKYIYLVDKKAPNSARFRFLLDGSKNFEEKSEFLEPFVPLNIKKFNLALDTQKSVFFQHHNDDTKLWMTYIKPFVIDTKTVALLVFDFSLNEYTTIVKVSNELDESFRYGFVFYLIIFLVIIWFSFVDIKRERLKQDINKKLKEKSFQLKELNESLEDRIHQEIEKNRLKDQQLLEQSRLAQMGEMISMIAHQWRQPLNAISSMSTSIKLKLALGKADKEFLVIASDKILHSSEYLSQTINDFRNFYKSQKSIEKTSFDEILKDVLNIIGVSLENKKIELKVDIRSKEHFYSYQNELKQVLMNLIKNAEDVLIENEISNATIYIDVYKEKELNVLTIRDNAGGVDEKIMDSIFDPYFSTKKQKDGTGLGLYMSKTIVEEHCSGELSVKNVEDGACFIVKVPTKEVKLS